MVLNLKDENGKIFSYMEWMVVNKDGLPQDGGEYLLIRDLWIHPEYTHGKVIHLFVKMLNHDKLNENVKYIYWQNLKNNERVSRLLTRMRALKKFKL